MDPVGRILAFDGIVRVLSRLEETTGMLAVHIVPRDSTTYLRSVAASSSRAFSAMVRSEVVDYRMLRWKQNQERYSRSLSETKIFAASAVKVRESRQEQTGVQNAFISMNLQRRTEKNY